jgi:hypothetical protein
MKAVVLDHFGGFETMKRLSRYASKTAGAPMQASFPRPSGLRDLRALLCGSLFVRWPENLCTEDRKDH